MLWPRQHQLSDVQCDLQTLTSLLVVCLHLSLYCTCPCTGDGLVLHRLNKTLEEHRIVCCRQVFLVMYCLAAVCLDASDAARTNFEEEQREQALVKVEADIVNLLKCTTPYTLATAYGGVLAQLVYLRRALTHSSGIDQQTVSNFNSYIYIVDAGV